MATMKHFLLTASVFFAASTAGNAHADLLGEFGDWAAFVENNSSGKVCFAASQPKNSEGNYKKRGDVFAIVSHNPQENTIGEVSFQAGYAFKKDVDAVVRIDGRKSFKLFTQGESAWTYDKKSDAQVVAAMKAGTTMVVNGVSGRGTKTVDTYSLKGFTRAHDEAARACGIK